MMMRRSEFLMMRRPAPPYKKGSIGTYYTTSAHVISITETWLTDAVPDRAVNIPNRLF
jgi:hypothetical protein